MQEYFFEWFWGVIFFLQTIHSAVQYVKQNKIPYKTFIFGVIEIWPILRCSLAKGDRSENCLYIFISEINVINMTMQMALV